MRIKRYDDLSQKSTISEIPTALKAFNDSVTRLLKEVELSQHTVDGLGSIKVEVNQQIRRSALNSI
jgi:hypothetical protein